jgi:hypothetical protein
MPSRIDVSKFALQATKEVEPPMREIRGNRRSPFFAGPVDLAWLQMAAQLPGKALHCALCMCHLARLQRSRSVSFSPGLRRAFGIGRKGAAQGLNALAKAGLVKIEGRSKGAAPVISLVGGLDA